MKRIFVVVLAAVSLLATLLAAPPVAAQDASSSAFAEAQARGATYHVEFTNLTEGQYLTPPNFAAHTSSVRVFERGAPASEAVQGVAENGNVPGLAEALQLAVDDAGLGVSGVGADAPVAPGETVQFEFTTVANELSIVAMLICTNDGFAGLNSRRLPTRNGQTVTAGLRAYDAGTEINTEAREDLVPAPFCGEGDGSGESNPELAENGVVRRHRGIQGVGDLDESFDWSGLAARVRITRVDPAATYHVRFTNLTPGQYLTPPNFAAHTSDVDVFQRGEAASPAVQGVAENGNVPGLAEALHAAVDEAGYGVSGVGADAPVAPGATVEFEFTTTADRLSIVAMLICTNDGFAGLDSRRLPRSHGHTARYWLRGYDAGTEINTEAREDLVPAPFCGEGDGSGESNPELAENGVIGRHRGIQGVGDLDDSFDWRGAVAELEVTRVDAAPTYTVTIENTAGGQYVTPPNVAIHDGSVDAVDIGGPASAALQQLAENGDVPGMAAALAALVDEAGLGASGVAGDAPLAPGAAATIHLTTHESRITVLSMLICTNDGFGGLDRRVLALGAGDSFVYRGKAYDAGTEVNTEARGDLVPAPFCGDGDGSGATNPDLAEGGVIAPHPGIQGVGDLDESFEFRRGVLRVTITRS